MNGFVFILLKGILVREGYNFRRVQLVFIVYSVISSSLLECFEIQCLEFLNATDNSTVPYNKKYEQSILQLTLYCIICPPATE